MPENTLMPATVKKAKRQPSTPSGRCAPTLVAKNAPAMPPARVHGWVVHFNASACAFRD